MRREKRSGLHSERVYWGWREAEEEEEEEGGGGGGGGGGPTPGMAKGEEVLVLEWGGVSIPVAGIRGGPKTRQEQTQALIYS